MFVKVQVYSFSDANGYGLGLWVWRFDSFLSFISFTTLFFLLFFPFASWVCNQFSFLFCSLLLQRRGLLYAALVSDFAACYSCFYS